MIELKNLFKSYELATKSISVLKNIQLQINAGELVAIMGPSGSGKSTLMNILGLLDRPSQGKYYFAGTNVSDLKQDELAEYRNRFIGFIFQSFMLLPRMTILQNICLPLIYQANQNFKKEMAIEILTKLKMQNFADRKPSELSGGQQQRIAIARALITNPKIILADEPTGSLDSSTGQEIMNLLSELHLQEKRTIIIVTHDAQIAQQCQRIIHLNDGMIIDEK